MNTEQQVGAHLGFSIVNELKKKQLNVQEVTTTEQLFQMLQLGRLPVVAVQDTTAQQFLSSKKIKNITKVEPAITTKDYYLVCLVTNFMMRMQRLQNRYGEKLEHSERRLTQSMEVNILSDDGCS